MFVQQPHVAWLDLAASLVTVVGQTEVVGTIALGVALARLRARRSEWWMPLLLAVVFVMALTRVYLAEHWPSDVVGGWLLGYGIAAVISRRP